MGWGPRLAGVMRGMVGFVSLADCKACGGPRVRRAASAGQQDDDRRGEAAIARIVADVKALEAARGGKGAGCKIARTATPSSSVASMAWRSTRRFGTKAP